MSNFSGPMERWQDPADKDSRLLVQFSIDKIFLEAETKKRAEKGDETPLWEDREFVTIRIPGDNQTVLYRQVSEADKVRFAEQYARFKANAGQQYVGVPLSEWPGMTPARIKMLEYFNIYTVEHLAGAEDVQIQKMGMDGVELRKKARNYLMKAKGDDPEKEAMRQQLAKQADEMAAIRDQLAAMGQKASAPVSRKRGRPANAERGGDPAQVQAA
jgi:hypothetical protein